METGEGGRSECRDIPQVANEYLTLPLIASTHTVITKGRHYSMGYMIEKYGWLRVLWCRDDFHSYF
jgi:hypothetical protein